MEESREHNSGEEARMFPDSELLPKMKALHEPHSSVSIGLASILFDEALELINRVSQTVGERSQLQDAISEGRKGKPVLGEIDDISNHVITVVSSQMTSEILWGNGAHSITMNLLKTLAKYHWQDKLVVTLTAFALTFGDFWLLVRIYSDNAISETITTDDQAASENKAAYKNQIKDNNDLIKGVAYTTRYLHDTGELLLNDSTKASDQLPVCVYWIIRCSVVAATQIIILSSRGLDQYLVGIRAPKEVEKLKSISFRNDNVELMRSFLTTDDDLPPLYHGVTKTKDQLNVLRTKRVLLLISGLDIAPEIVENLKHVKTDSKLHEIVWVPIVNRSNSELDHSGEQTQLETLRDSMPWYSIHQPSMITDDAVKFFRSKWEFKSRPILVLISYRGEVLNKNAIHMVRIWDNLSVDDLTSEGELKLWEKAEWNLKLLVNDIGPNIQKWIQEEKYIFLYGGKNVEWIRKFTMMAKKVASELKVEIEMVYMGTRHSKDGARHADEIIATENLSHYLPESSMTYFWSRIDSMIYSKTKLGKMNDPKDKVLQKIVKFHSHVQEWVLLAKGSRILVDGPGRAVLGALEEIGEWQEKGMEPGFVDEFGKHSDDVHQCIELVLPAIEDAPDTIVCPDCQRNMEFCNFLVCC